MLTAKAAGAVLLAILVCAALPTMFLVNGQTNQITEETMVALAEQSADELKTLIASIYAEENSTAKIENVDLTEQFQGNVTLFQTDGLGQLSAAKYALANSNYDSASQSALDALTLYRHVYLSLQSILSFAGVADYTNLTNQDLLDAVTRELQRLETLQSLLPAEASQVTLTALSDANRTLLQAKVALQANQTALSGQLYVEAKQKITQIYQYLKTQAEESNTWRLTQYCQTLQVRIQERLNYANNSGVNSASALASIGYQSQAAFMQALQNKIQSAQSKVNIQDAITECLSISQMVQQTEQAINQEISRQQQGQASPSSNGAGGGSTAGPTVGGNSTGSGGSNVGGSGGNGGSGNGSGGNK